MVGGTKLSELEPGERGVVIRVIGPSDIKRRLLDMGFVRGTEVLVVRKAPLADPVEYEVKGYNVSLRREEAACVIVEPVEEGGGT